MSRSALFPQFLMILIMCAGLYIHLAYGVQVPWNQKSGNPHGQLLYLGDLLAAGRGIRRSHIVQPPMFHAIVVEGLKLSGSRQLTEPVVHRLQLMCVFVSSLTLLVWYFLGFLLFRGDYSRVVYLAVVTSLGGPLLALSGHLGSEGLFALLSSLCLASIIRWWLSNENVWGWSTGVFLSCALLTHPAGLMLFGIVALTLLGRIRLELRMANRGWALQTGADAVRFFCLPLLFCSWYYIQRASEGQSIFLFGEPQTFSEEYTLEKTTGALTTFNPMEILDAPFFNPDWRNERRTYFLEEFFKSLFLGNQYLHPESLILPQMVLILGISGIIVFLLGWYSDFAFRTAVFLPMAAYILVPFVTLVGYRLLFPYATLNDAGLIAWTTPAFAYFIARGVALHGMLFFPALAMCIANATFLLHLVASYK